MPVLDRDLVQDGVGLYGRFLLDDLLVDLSTPSEKKNKHILHTVERVSFAGDNFRGSLVLGFSRNNFVDCMYRMYLGTIFVDSEKNPRKNLLP